MQFKRNNKFHIFLLLALSLGITICPLYAEVTQCQENANCAPLNDTHKCVCDSGFHANGRQCLGEYLSGLGLASLYVFIYELN